MLHSTRPPGVLFLLLLLAWIPFAAGNLRAQQEDKDKAIVTVDDTAWAGDGSLLLSVRIEAPPTHAISLGKVGPMVSGRLPDVALLSLAKSCLVDSFSGNKIAALPRLPEGADFGPMATSIQLSPRSWIHMAVAFPAPPPPPPGPDGAAQPYKLTLYLPLDAKPIVLTIPPKSDPAGPKK